MTFHSIEYLEIPASSLEREATGAGNSSLAPAPTPHSIPAGAATTHDPARRGLGGMDRHFEAMHAETQAQRIMRFLCWLIAAFLLGAIGLFAFFVAGKLGANVALAFIQAGY